MWNTLLQVDSVTINYKILQSVLYKHYLQIKSRTDERNIHSNSVSFFKVQKKMSHLLMPISE